MPAARALFPAAIALGVMLLLASCASNAAGPPVGVSTAAPEPHEPAAASESPRKVWSDYTAAEAWPTAGPASVALGHRRDGALIEVRVEPSALAAYRDLAVESPMPDGARVLALLRTPGGKPLGGYVLEKRAGAWSGKQLDAAGTLVPTDEAACLRCHELAPADHLFGLPRRPQSPPRGTEESLAAPAR